jgi:hypothetical protein
MMDSGAKYVVFSMDQIPRSKKDKKEVMALSESERCN